MLAIIRTTFSFVAVLSGVAQADSLMFTIDNVRNGNGQIAYNICREDEFDAAINASAVCDIAGLVEAQTGQTLFGVSLAQGSYAVMIMHDEDRDGELKRQGLLPQEGVGFSQNPRLIFGAPSFSKVAVEVDGHGGTTIEMKYF